MGAISVFPALQHRNFRLLWLGLLVSFSGNFMQTAAILWHVSLLAPDDQRALALGLVGLVRVVPVIGFSLLSGVAADALDRRRLMLVTQSTMALLARRAGDDDVPGALEPVAHLRAGGVQLRGGRVRSARAAVARAQPRAARAPAERDHAQHDHGADRLGGRARARRRRHRDRRRRVGIRLERGVVPDASSARC